MTDQEIVSQYKLTNYIPNWASSRFQERIMRFGIEARSYYNYGGAFDPSQLENLTKYYL